MERIVRPRVCFQLSLCFELFGLWFDLEYLVCKAGMFGTGQYFMHLVGVLGENGTYSDKDYL